MEQSVPCGGRADDVKAASEWAKHTTVSEEGPNITSAHAEEPSSAPSAKRARVGDSQCLLAAANLHVQNRPCHDEIESSDAAEHIAAVGRGNLAAPAVVEIGALSIAEQHPVPAENDPASVGTYSPSPIAPPHSTPHLPRVEYYGAGIGGAVWSVAAVRQLHQLHVTGQLSGPLARAPRQNVQLALPLQLMPEELHLLQHTGLAELVRHPSLQAAPSAGSVRQLRAIDAARVSEQQRLLQAARHKQILERADTIAAGKLRQLRRAGRDAGISRQQLRHEFVEKIRDAVQPPAARVCLLQLFRGHPLLMQPEVVDDRPTDGEAREMQLVEPDSRVLVLATSRSGRAINSDDEHPYTAHASDDLRQSDVSRHRSITTGDVTRDFTGEVDASVTLRSAVYGDLWRRGYHLTDGLKFGVDFLAYPGDPLVYHAQFLVCCVEGSASPRALAGLQRLAQCCGKVLLLSQWECTGDGRRVRHTPVCRHDVQLRPVRDQTATAEVQCSDVDMESNATETCVPAEMQTADRSTRADGGADWPRRVEMEADWPADQPPDEEFWSS